MRNPRPEDFSTQVFGKKADPIDLTGVVPLRSKKQPEPEQSQTEKHVSVPSRQHDGMTASHHDSTPSRQHDSMTAGQLSYVLTYLTEKATQKTTIRLPAG